VSDHTPDLGILLVDDLALKAHEGTKTVTRRPMRPDSEQDPEPGHSWRECLCHAIDPADTPCDVCHARFGPAVLAGAGTARPGQWPGDSKDPDAPSWRPSIHMPKWASRTWGRIVSVRPWRITGPLCDCEARREGFDDPEALRQVLRDTYPDVEWFWRVEWVRIETPTVSR